MLVAVFDGCQSEVLPPVVPAPIAEGGGFRGVLLHVIVPLRSEQCVEGFGRVAHGWFR